MRCATGDAMYQPASTMTIDAYFLFCVHPVIQRRLRVRSDSPGANDAPTVGTTPGTAADPIQDDSRRAMACVVARIARPLAGAGGSSLIPAISTASSS